MTLDAMKEKLLEVLSDNANIAGIIDEVIETEAADRALEKEAREAEIAKEETRTAEIERMRGEIEALNRTNERLISKIKYGAEAKDDAQEDEENVDITIADLFRD